MAADEALRSSEIVESGRGPGRGVAVLAVAVVGLGVVLLGLSRSSEEESAPTTSTASPSTTIDQAGPIVEPGPGVDVGEVTIEVDSLFVAGTAFIATSPEQGQLISTDGFTWERVRGAVGPVPPSRADDLVDIRSVGCGVDLCLQVRDAADRIVAAGPTPIEIADAGPYVGTSASVAGATRTEAGWVVVLSVSSSVDVARVIAELRPDLEGEIGGYSINADRLLVDVGGDFVEITVEELAVPDGQLPDDDGGDARVAVLSSIDGAIWEVVGTMPGGRFVGLDIVDGDPYVLVAGRTLADPIAYVGAGGVAVPWKVVAIEQPDEPTTNFLWLLEGGAFVTGSDRRFVGWRSDLTSVTFEPPIPVGPYEVSPDLRSFVGVSGAFGAVVWSDDGGETFEQVEIELPIGTAPGEIVRSGDRAVISVFDTGPPTSGAPEDLELRSLGLVAVELTSSGG
ncbi:MAG: hypothetical protein AAGD18_24725 [Actinomycetota bacterium]